MRAIREAVSCVLVALLGCAQPSSGNVPAPEAPAINREPPPALDPAGTPTVHDAPTTTDEAVVDPQPTQAGSECTDPRDCVVVRDRCSRPYGRPTSNPVAPRAPTLCPPAAYAFTEPSCEQGRCVAVTATNQALRACRQTKDCMATPWVCGGWWAIARTERSAADQYLQEMGAHRSCRAATPTPAPRVACMAEICVTR